MICMAVSCGSDCHRHATAPQEIGDENDVPLAVVSVPLPLTTAEWYPIAMISGFTRPSADGPTEENPVLIHCSLTAPTVRMLSASPGTLIFFHDPNPSLPALATRIIPLPASSDADREQMDVRPSSSR